MKLKSEREIDIYSKGFSDGINWFRENADLKAIIQSTSDTNKEIVE